MKDVRQSRVGDTVTSLARPATQDLGGYRHPNPMVYAGLYPMDADDYPELREALDKLQLNDAALVYEPETSGALGFGFRIGFLGLLHMEIVRERLEREFNLDLISTAPSVVYRVVMENGAELTVTNPSEYPTDGKIAEVHEPVVKATILTPTDYIGTILELCQTRRGVQHGMEYLSADRVEIRYTLPLAEIVFDFFDALKSRTKGYASLDYEPDGEQVADLVKVDILLQGEPVDAFSAVVHKDKAYAYGLLMAGKLKDLIPRQQFEVPIQAAIGARVIARETIRAIRKDVLAKCYGGDITRKRKLLEKQKEGKKRMKMVGRVEVPRRPSSPRCPPPSPPRRTRSRSTGVRPARCSGQPVEPEEPEVVDGQHGDLREAGAAGVVGEHRPPHHRAGGRRRRRGQPVGQADEQAEPVHALVDLGARRGELVGDRLVHDHHRAVGPTPDRIADSTSTGRGMSCRHSKAKAASYGSDPGRASPSVSTNSTRSVSPALPAAVRAASIEGASMSTPTTVAPGRRAPGPGSTSHRRSRRRGSGRPGGRGQRRAPAPRPGPEPASG